MKYHNQCHKCDEEWDSEDFWSSCPECGENEDVGIDLIDETPPNQSPKIQ